MQKIVVNGIPGGLEDFLDFMEVQAETPSYKDKFEVEPQCRTEENSTGARGFTELTGVALAGAWVALPLILSWMEHWKNNIRERDRDKALVLDVTLNDDDGENNRLNEAAEKNSLMQLRQSFQSIDPHGDIQLNLRIRRVKKDYSEVDILKHRPGSRPIHIQSSAREPQKVLILSSNPKTTGRLRFDEEMREIEKGLLLSIHAGNFVLHSCLAVQLRDIRQALLYYKPQIVHFTGHGVPGGLMVESKLGTGTVANAEALAELFGLCSEYVKCVILNACSTLPLAEGISQHVDYAVGMKDVIKDRAAIAFSIGFYDALGAGEPVEKAFEFGCNAIRHEFPNQEEHLVPMLKKRKRN